MSKITCSCGCMMLQKSLQKHLQTRKHMLLTEEHQETENFKLEYFQKMLYDSCELYLRAWFRMFNRNTYRCQTFEDFVKIFYNKCYSDLKTFKKIKNYIIEYPNLLLPDDMIKNDLLYIFFEW